MAKKSGVRFVCSNCGFVSSSWAGRCSLCGEWNTFQEEVEITTGTSLSKKGMSLSPTSVTQAVKTDQTRYVSNNKDLDTVFGGGLVAGSVTLITGQPGIGKSTLLLQVASNISMGVSTLYVSGEESIHQIGLRAQRLKLAKQKLNLATSTSADDIAATIQGGDYKVVIIDSIQTLATVAANSPAGSVSQVSNSAQILIAAAKQSNTAIIIVGHVTKEGSIAGPKILEHMVDVVLHLEGDPYGGFKILRATKNRYGSTSEAAIYEMKTEGLISVDNPSASLLAERQVCDGSVVLATLEGSRPVLVEVQALVNRTNYGYPKRAASGIDLNRVNLLIAMLERRTKLNLSDKDVYINIVGGLKITEPAADLAICMAIGSAAKGLQLKSQAVVFGEVGLSGEVRHVPYIEKRIAEANKLGFEYAIGPIQKSDEKIKGLLEVPTVRDALNKYLEKN